MDLSLTVKYMALSRNNDPEAQERVISNYSPASFSFFTFDSARFFSENLMVSRDSATWRAVVQKERKGWLVKLCWSDWSEALTTVILTDRFGRKVLKK